MTMSARDTEAEIAWQSALAEFNRIKAEGRLVDEKYLARYLARINDLAERTLCAIPDTELHKPLLMIMSVAQEARRRLLND